MAIFLTFIWKGKMKRKTVALLCYADEVELHRRTHNFLFSAVGEFKLVERLALRVKFSADDILNFFFLIFFFRKLDLTFHANCLHWRQFALNVKSCSLGKKRKNITNLLSAEFVQRVLKVKDPAPNPALLLPAQRAVFSPDFSKAESLLQFFFVCLLL